MMPIPLGDEADVEQDRQRCVDRGSMSWAPLTLTAAHLDPSSGDQIERLANLRVGPHPFAYFFDVVEVYSRWASHHAATHYFSGHRLVRWPGHHAQTLDQPMAPPWRDLHLGLGKPISRHSTDERPRSGSVSRRRPAHDQPSIACHRGIRTRWRARRPSAGCMASCPANRRRFLDVRAPAGSRRTDTASI